MEDDKQMMTVTNPRELNWHVGPMPDMDIGTSALVWLRLRDGRVLTIELAIMRASGWDFGGGKYLHNYVTAIKDGDEYETLRFENGDIEVGWYAWVQR